VGWNDWESYRSAPRRPANGIKAQTQRGRFGKSWWAGRWIAALERLVDPARLARGRSYARSGQVVKLEIGRGGVAALVQGSRPSPYRVSIRFKPLSDARWDRVADAMAAEAIHAARLLSGEMPEQIEEVFAAAGASLLPAERGDLATDCSCPDWANPCKHVAAVHYLLGERFDADPFLMFELRGRGKDEIVVELRDRRAGGPTEEPLAPAVATEDQPESTPPLSKSLAGFWSAPGGVPDPGIGFEPPAVDALPVKRLGAPAFWSGGSDFTRLMEDAYRTVAAHARRELLGDA
jgi:uncharacterized Zn finger protein